MSALALVVLVLSAYFLYHGLMGLYRIAVRPYPHTMIDDTGRNIEHVSPIHPMHVAVVLAYILGGGYGIKWGLSKLR
jgi:hypothetical protein|uniref:Uncharacterized protein n=1 Tax=viral metagenome TaxID=1070528 RepID=A0A6C0CR81_9ZZZZ